VKGRDEGKMKASNELRGDNEPASLRSRMGPLLFLVGIFFSNILARFALTPMMPVLERELQLGHDEAGSLVFTLSLGYSLLLLGSGFISRRLTHKGTIVASCGAVCGAATLVASSHSLWGIRIGFFLVGMAAGVYLPSAIATITELVTSKDWGKAIALHELAPNLGFVLSPLVVEMLLRWMTWRQSLILFGVLCLGMGLVFLRFGKGGNFPGEAPNIGTVRVIFSDRSFWIIMILFCLGIGASFGVYSMLPLYLVAEKEVERTWANTWVGLSRVPTLVMVFAAGWAADHLGPKRTMRGVFFLSGVSTVLLSLVPGSWFVPVVFLQCLCATSFFPAGFAALSRIGSPRTKNVALSLTMPISILVGAGMVPAGIGIAGQWGSFGAGFAALGALLLMAAFAVPYMELSEGCSESRGSPPAA